MEVRRTRADEIAGMKMIKRNITVGVHMDEREKRETVKIARSVNVSLIGCP